MNKLIEFLSTNTPNANKLLRTWYDSAKFTKPFTEFIMHPDVLTQIGIFKVFFMSQYNVDITVSERGYDIYAATVTQNVIDDFRFKEESGDFYIERVNAEITNPDYLSSKELRYEYWTIRAIYDTMVWIEICYTPKTP